MSLSLYYPKADMVLDSGYKTTVLGLSYLFCMLAPVLFSLPCYFLFLFVFLFVVYFLLLFFLIAIELPSLLGGLMVFQQSSVVCIFSIYPSALNTNTPMLNVDAMSIGRVLLSVDATLNPQGFQVYLFDTNAKQDAKFQDFLVIFSLSLGWH
jgi:hypothetical protein